MRASSKLIERIKQFEGCKLAAYKDSAGVWTIGYGHTKGVRQGDRITQYQAEQFLREDLGEFEAVANNTRRISTQGQFDAVVDFCYNCGSGNFKGSTLRAYIEGGMPVWQIQEQFLKWVYSNKVKLGGLVTRRIWEANRFAE